MNITISVIVFLYGLIFTSFFQLLGERFVKKEKMTTRSHCPHCHHTLRYRDIIPVLGYVGNKGRCHFCGQNINPFYPLFEVIGGTLFLMGYLSFGLNIDFFIYITFISALLINSSSDIEGLVVIDRVWIIALIILFVIDLLSGIQLYRIISSIVMFSSLYIFALVGKKIYKQEVLGGGDIKLFILIGFVLGVEKSFVALLISSIVGFVYGIVNTEKRHFFPFVPFILIGAALTYLYGDVLITWYQNLVEVIISNV